MKCAGDYTSQSSLRVPDQVEIELGAFALGDNHVGFIAEVAL